MADENVKPAEDRIAVFTSNADEAKALKVAVQAAGGVMEGTERTVRWDSKDKQFGVFVEKLDDGAKASVLEAIAPFQTAEAKAAWQAENAARASAAEAEKLVPAREVAAKVAKASIDDDPRPKIEVYPVFPEGKKQFEQMLETTSSVAKYDGEKRAWMVATDNPELFAPLRTPEAKQAMSDQIDKAIAARAAREAEKTAGRETDVARTTASEVGSRQFLGRYSKGFVLPRETSSDPSQVEAAAQRHRKALDMMQMAPLSQLKQVAAITSRRLTELSNQERELRAEKVGMSVDNFRKLDMKDWPDAAKGKVLDDVAFRDLLALQRGQKALKEFIGKMEGAAVEKPQDRSQEKTKDAVHKLDRAVSAKSQSPASVDSDKEAALVAQMANRRQQRGR